MRWPVVLLIGVLALFFLGYRWYQAGVELEIVTHPGMAAITLDGRPVGSALGHIQAGPEDTQSSITIFHVPFGKHEVTFAHDGYTETTTWPGLWPWSPEFDQQTTDSLSSPGGMKRTGARRWFWGDTYTKGSWPFVSYYYLELRLTRIVAITVMTNPPGCLIYLDGAEMGQSDGNGRLVLGPVTQGMRILQGTHTLKVYHYGLPISETKFDAEPDQIYRIDLYESQEPDLRKQPQAVASQASAPTLSGDEAFFQGTWKKVAQGDGQLLTNVLIIERIGSGSFRVREKEVMDNAEFRNVVYNNGTIKGTLHMAVDEDWTSPFAIRKSGVNTITYKDQRGEESFEK
jgi:hypothetical protein